nr:hypothetical protein [Tanacetum cinerariifolium]
MAKPILNENMEKAQTESNLSITCNDINIELNKEFLEELQNNTYHGWIDEDVMDHIAKVLEMIDLIYIPGVNSHQLRMKIFPLSLADDARQWWINDGEGKITVWEELLGIFLGRSDDGFFLGYSLNSKAFRVYNFRTRKVEENLHIRFLENKPIIAGDGPKWLFNINALTKSMSYVPIVAGTNSNNFVGTEESIGACHASKVTGSSNGYILMSLWKDGLLFDYSLKNASNNEPQPSNDDGNKDDEGVSKENRIDDQERPKNDTQDVNTVGPSINTDSTSVNTEVDISNISTTHIVPSAPNTRIHEDHSLDHVIGDVQSGVQTMRMTKTTHEQGFISAIYEGKTHKHLHTCLFACFLSQEEPKKGYTQEEGIDYDEVFAPVARIKAIRLVLAFASFKDFVVYQIDVKSAFLYGKIEEEVYVYQPSGFEDPKGQIDKTLFIKRFKGDILLVQMSSMGELTFFLGLQVTQNDDGIFISQDKYVDEILKKFGFSTVKTTSTPMETSKTLLKDAEAEDVNVYLYRSMIGSLMYLTASRPDIIFA